MLRVINSAKPGDKLKVVFANRTFNGDLTGRLYFILAMCAPLGEALHLGEMSFATLKAVADSGKWDLKAVADSGKWEGFRTYTFTVLPGFDPEWFANRTLGHDLLESIERIAKDSTIISSGRYLYHLQDIAEIEATSPVNPIQQMRLSMLKAEAAEFEKAKPDEARRLQARAEELARLAK